MKILIVDDEARNLKLLEGALMPLNYDIMKAVDGQSALKLVNENNDIDLILLDIMSPQKRFL